MAEFVLCLFKQTANNLSIWQTSRFCLLVRAKQNGPEGLACEEYL